MFSAVKTTVTLSLLLSTFAAHAIDINGAGSSAAQPLYVKLADVYGKSQNLKLNYQANGSSEGIKQVKAKTVEFGATDIAPSLGHPRVWLEIDEHGYVDCGYCDRRFVLKGGPADGADQAALPDIASGMSV